MFLIAAQFIGILAVHLPSGLTSLHIPLGILAAIHVQLAVPGPNQGIQTPGQDTTGVNNALYALARYGARWVGGVFALFLMWHGLGIITSGDNAARQGHIRMALGTLILGGILVLAAVTVAPTFVNSIVTGQ